MTAATSIAIEDTITATCAASAGGMAIAGFTGTATAGCTNGWRIEGKKRAATEPPFDFSDFTGAADHPQQPELNSALQRARDCC
jgi:beta-phosphoglucomutase-like phosphatase (HAD superfamily)